MFTMLKNVFLVEVEFRALSNQDLEIRSRSKTLYKKLLNLFELVINKGIRNGEFVDADATSVFTFVNFPWYKLVLYFGENELSLMLSLRIQRN